jgi:GxxExxY protein
MEDFLKLACDKIYRDLGPCHSENTYKNALLIELQEEGYKFQTEVVIPFTYKNQTVGYGRIDILTEHGIIELKATQSLKKHDSRQLTIYLNNTDSEIGYLINFPYNPSPGTLIQFKVIEA